MEQALGKDISVTSAGMVSVIGFVQRSLDLCFKGIFLKDLTVEIFW